MTDDIAIRVENIAKRYRIGAREEAHETLAGAVVDWLKQPGRNLQQLRRLTRFSAGESESSDIIWALRDVSFEVKRGEVLGIIGRNGAGKSTLLKILSQITYPTKGRFDIFGRVSSLLEIGTGFHPELTGRENIYLNGTILGMRRAEIDRKFDEIVDFSGVEKFLDTPVKRYSSGMGVRLAFSVAAFLEPEILLVDEVLAVGDAQFQKKSLGKMREVTGAGRTILFVSHNMVAVQSLCHRALWLEEGHIKGSGPTAQVISSYLQSSLSSQHRRIWPDPQDAPGNEFVRIHKVFAHPVDGDHAAGGTQSAEGLVDTISTESAVAISIEFWNMVPGARLHVTLHVYTEQMVVAFSTGSVFALGWENKPYPVGLFRSVCLIPGNLLNSGNHRVTLLVVQDRSRIIYRHEGILSFDVLDLMKREEGWQGKEPGVIRPMLNWSTEQIGSLPEKVERS